MVFLDSYNYLWERHLMGLSKKHFSPTHLYLAQLYSALGAAPRLAILEYLVQNGQANVKELTEHLQLSQSTVSAHLKRLLSINLIEAREVETSVIYTIEKGVK